MMTFKISAVLDGKTIETKTIEASSWDEAIASGRNERTATECNYISVKRQFKSGRRDSKSYLIF